jgi:hypothetical protein
MLPPFIAGKSTATDMLPHLNGVWVRFSRPGCDSSAVGTASVEIEALDVAPRMTADPCRHAIPRDDVVALEINTPRERVWSAWECTTFGIRP